MRPRYLEIEGLQSFKDIQVIDFDKLGETGLFGIFGPTGSGKSSILDAITLALYGNVQRANRGTQGIANVDMNTVKVGFVFDLLKDGKNKTYKVERTYRRKKASDNSVEIKVARLFEIIDNETLIIADKPAEVTQRIEELVGLQLDDFTRSVVLPQNKFQEFLIMDKSRKRDMMERIFYLEEYGRNLTEKLNKKLSLIKYKLSGIEGAMSALGELSEKSLIEAESAMNKSKESKEAVDARLKIAETAFEEARGVWELTCDLEVVLDRERKHGMLLDNITSVKTQYGKALKALSISEIVESYIKMQENLTLTVDKLKEIDAQLPLVKESLETEKVKFDISRKESDLQKPLLIQYKAKLEEALTLVEDSEKINTQLNNMRGSYIGLKSKLDEITKDIKSVKDNIQLDERELMDYSQQIELLKVDLDYRQQVQQCLRIEDEISNIKKTRSNMEFKAGDQLKTISAIEKDLNELKSNGLNQQKELEGLSSILTKIDENKPSESPQAILQEGEVYHSLKSAFETIKLVKKDTDLCEAKVQECRLQIKVQGDICIEKENELKKLEQVCKDRKLLLDELKVIKERSTALRISKNLIEGSPCPVCGSHQHPSPAHIVSEAWDGDIEAKLEAAQKEYDDSQKVHSKCELEAAMAAELLKSMEKQLLQHTENLILKREQYEDLLKRLPENIRNLGLGEIQDKIEDINNLKERKLQEFEEWERKRLEVERTIKNIQEAASLQKMEQSKKDIELNICGENLSGISKELEEINIELEHTTLMYKNAMSVLGISNAHDEIARLDSNHRKAMSIQKQINAVETRIKASRVQLEKLENERTQKSEEFNDVSTNGKILKTRKEEIDKKVAEIAEGKDIQKELSLIDQKAEELEKMVMRTELKLRELQESFNSKQMQKQTLENQKNIYSDSLELETKRLLGALKEYEFENIEEVKSSILPDKIIESFKKQIEDYEEAARNIEAQKKILMSKLQGRNMTEEDWNKIKNQYEALKHEKEKFIAAYENSKSQYLSYKKNFEQWAVLDKERKLFGRKKEMLEQIQKLLKGNSFIEFISEERLRYIAREATETLGILTKYRYALELDTENGFVIRDNANGGACRLVSSLSGGETFLTSLSLALALSSQIQLKGQSPLEFFFLDEGFGTLDEELLNTVIDSLERLSSTRKVIGLISHVPELRNRISRRLIVEPPSNDGVGSRVRLEKA